MHKPHLSRRFMHTRLRQHLRRPMRLLLLRLRSRLHLNIYLIVVHALQRLCSRLLQIRRFPARGSPPNADKLMPA